MPNFSESNKFFSFIKCYSNSKLIAKWSYKVSCGNAYLCDFAAFYNTQVIYNPTTIDTVNYHNKIKDHSNSKLVIGWTGSHSTIRYLDDLLPVFEKLEKKYDFELRVIADIAPEFKLKSLVFVPWNKNTEIADLMAFNVGIMPLQNDKWAQGKCGFKALQYMALGIPALVSPVGVNTRIVDDGINGFICTTNEDWYANLELLLNDKMMLKTMAEKTRKKIEQHYSVTSNTDNFIELFS